MKKKISLLGLILILVLSFTGCGKSETTEYDQATLEQYAEFVVQNFEAMTTEQLDSFSDMRDLQLDTQLMNAGLPVDGEDFLTMISSWEAAEEECGAYVEHGDWTMEVKNDGVSLTSEAKYENRDADIVFSFDEKGNMESMDVSAHYSTGEILEKAGLNTVLGMGTVFVVLIFISFIIYLLGYIPKFQEKLANKDKKVEEKKEAPVQAAPAPAAAQVAAPRAAAPAAPAAAPKAAAGAGSIQVKAGAAGKVFQVPTSVGQKVEAGDTVIIIEAMKMEIPVVAPEAGTIASIDVAVGDAVESGAVLATLN